MKQPYQVALVSAVFAVAACTSSASAKCMSLAIKQPDGSTTNILAVAPDTGSADLDAAGYKDASCGNLDKAAYLEKVCNPGTWGNSGVQRQFAIQAGISLAQLCSAARAEGGLSDLTPSEMTQRFLPPNSRVPTAATNTGTLAGQVKAPPMVGPLAGVDAATTQTGGQ